jgi:hypothetical protein
MLWRPDVFNPGVLHAVDIDTTAAAALPLRRHVAAFCGGRAWAHLVTGGVTRRCPQCARLADATQPMRLPFD